MKRNRPFSLALVLFCLAQYGCTGSAHGDWEPVEPPYKAALKGRTVYEVRMSVTDSVVRLRAPAIVGDSIRGEWKPHYERAVALDQLTDMEAVSEPAGGVPTWAIVAGGVLVIGAVVFVATDDYYF